MSLSVECVSLVLQKWLRLCDKDCSLWNRWPHVLDDLVSQFQQDFYEIDTTKGSVSDFRLIDKQSFQSLCTSGYAAVVCNPIIEMGGNHTFYCFKMTVVEFKGNDSNHYLGLVKCEANGDSIGQCNYNFWATDYGGILGLVSKNHSDLELHKDYSIEALKATDSFAMDENWKDGDSIGFKVDTNLRTAHVYRNDECLGLAFTHLPAFVRPIFNPFGPNIVFKVESCRY